MSELDVQALKVFLNVKKGERLKTALLFAWILLFICVYYVMRPIRRGLVLEDLGNDKMPFVYIGTALATGVVVWLYAKLSHLPRKNLILGTYGFFLLNLIGWWEAFHFSNPVTSGLFWVWLDVFSIMGVTVFWMYANDVCDSESAKRTFGILCAGGGLGAVVGSSLTAALVKPLGAVNMLLVAAGLVAVTMAIFIALERNIGAAPVKRKSAVEFDKAELTTLKGMVSTILGNKFLLFLAAVVCFERMTPDMVQFIYHDVLSKMSHGHEGIAALDATLEQWRGIAELGVEVFLVAFVLRRFGTGACLASSAVTILSGVALFALFMNPVIMLFTFHADELNRHAWFKSAKELTYTVTSRNVLFSIKPFIEMFCYRFSRGIAGLALYLVNSVLGFGIAGVMVLAMIAAACWGYFGLRLSKEFTRLEEENQPPTQISSDNLALSCR
jgi:AAA family ATP:ADP antiporter